VRYYATVAASTSAVAALLTFQYAVQLVPALGPWTAVAVALLACLYGGYGYTRYRRTMPLGARQALARPPYHVGAALSLAALLWPGTAPLQGAVVAGLLAVLYAYGVRRVRGPIPAVISVALLPLALANIQQAVLLPDPLLTWTLFALGVLALAEVAARQGMLTESARASGDTPLHRPAPVIPTGSGGGSPAPVVVTASAIGEPLAGDDVPAGSRRSQWAAIRRVGTPLSRALGEPIPTQARPGDQSAAEREVGISVSWRSPFALPLFALGYAVGLAVFGVCLAHYAAAFAGTGLPAYDGEVVAATGLLVIGLLFQGLSRRLPAFLHLATGLVALPYLSLGTLWGAQLGWRDPYAGQAWALMALALVYLGAAALLDAARRRGGSVLYPAAYLFALLAPALVHTDRVTLSWLFGLALAACAWSAWLVATRRHRAFESWLAALAPPEFRPGARAAFGYLCAWLFPLWLLVASSARFPDLGGGAFGLALSFLAVAYLAVALLPRRIAPAQARPWLSAGLLLSLLGPWLALAAPATHAMGVWVVMALGVAYLGAGYLLDKGGRPGGAVAYPLGYLLPFMATLATLADGMALVWTFGLTLVTYAWSAWLVATGRHHTYPRARSLPSQRDGEEALFGYLVALLFPLWLLALFVVRFPDAGAGPYGLALTLLAAAYLPGARRLARVAPAQATPWLAGGVALSVVGPLVALADPWPRLAATLLALAVYCSAATLSRRPAWAYGAALALPVLAYALGDRLRLPSDAYGLALLPAALLLLAAGDRARLRGLARAWSRPFDMVGHVLLALLLLAALPAVLLATAGQARATVTVTALAYAAALAAHASWRRRGPSAWYGVGYGLAAVQGLLLLAHAPVADMPIYWALLGLVVALLCALFLPLRRPPWALPLGATRAALALLTPLAAASLGSVAPEGVAARTFTITIAVVGLQLVAEGAARRRRLRPLIYAGIACEGVAYVVQLVQHGIAQPQFYTIPAGLYLLGVAYAEWRIAPRRDVKGVLELAGLLIMLGTSLLQALGLMADGLPASFYDLVVMGEGIVALLLGGALHWRKTLYLGAAALCIDGGLIAYEPLRAINTWYIVAIVGLALIGGVVAIEKRRQQIVALVDGWRRLQEAWD